MHSRLPHFAGVPGRLSVAAVTAALLVSGCAPNFHSAEPSHLAPVSDAQDLPAMVKNTADTTMRDAASAVVQQVTEHQTQAPSPATETPSAEDPGETPQVPDARDAETSESEDAAAPTELEEWAESLTSAHEAAEQDQAQQQAEAEEEARLQAEAEAEAEAGAEEEAQRHAEAEQEAEEPAEEHTESEPEPEPELEEPAPTPGPPTESPEVSFEGDLEAFLTETASAYPGRIAISLQEVGGQARSASTGGAESFVTGSTYKLLVGYSLIREVESGELSWDDTALGERDHAQCFNDMLVISDNPCPEAIGPEIGWTKVYADAAEVGATNTSGGEGGIRTNAHDLTRFMTSLASGSMSMSDAGHERLRNALAANVHRQGIPAGSAGRVLNKPGFINGNLHDTAIVHHPAGTYVLTILSQGSSWSSLAGITRDVESALYG